ncbi:MAG: YeiH family putative sulfate export transporter [Albidovulum sp.]|nr:MAG: YeiH family putative sulfate export transporter [Defluviimonas sp.]
MTSALSQRARTSRAGDVFRQYAPGLLVCAVVGTAAQFLSDHYGAPAMLMALLLGIAFGFLAEDGRCVPGIDLTAKKVLRVGVAILGARVSAELMVGLGPEMVGLLILAVIFTIAFGVVCSRFLGRGWRFGVLTGGAVAICGASAAMAIAAVLPKNENSESNLIFTVLGVTVLSTLAMIFYPMLAGWMAMDDSQSGVFIGGTIHDVAQVVGAGFSVSDSAGEVATLVKLIRVTMLAPVILILSLVIRNSMGADSATGARPPLIPFFVVAFLIFAALNSFGAIPAGISTLLSEVSRWALLLSVSAVGMKTSLKRVLEVGGQAIFLIVAETLFIAAFVVAGGKLIS